MAGCDLPRSLTRGDFVATVRQFTQSDFTRAARHLAKADPVMARLVRAIKLETPRRFVGLFEPLVQIIIGQQLSGKAAQTIFRRLREATGEKKATPENLATLTDQQFRTAGVSAPKIRAIRNLVGAVLMNELRLNDLQKLPDEEIRARLIAIKGIGNWTAEMYIMFVLCRQDLFSPGDGGLKKAVALHYGPKLSDKKLAAISDKWRPYRTIACLYLWRSLDRHANTLKQGHRK